MVTGILFDFPFLSRISFLPVGLYALLVLALTAGCGTSAGDPGNPVQEDAQVTVFAAAALTEAFLTIAEAFEAQNPGVAVRLNFAGSQRLRSQLEFGAKADVFASADQVQMDLARAAGLTRGEPRIFATSSLAVIAADLAYRSRSLESLDLEWLASPGGKLAIAHPSVPAGAYALQVLDNLSTGPAGLGQDYAQRVLANLVTQENSVKTVEQKVVLGEVDAGLVYAPGARTALSAGKVTLISVPDEYNVTARFPLVQLADASDPALAVRFVDFVLSEQGQEILSDFEFGPP